MSTNTPQGYFNDKILKAKGLDTGNQLHLHEYWYNLIRSTICDAILRHGANQEDYLKFIDIVKDKKYFHIDHVRALNLPYDVLIFLSKKGIGKSYYMIQRCNEIVDAGGDVVLMRTMEEDRRCGLSEHLRSYNANFVMDQKGQLTHKHQTETIETEVEDDEGNIEIKKKKIKRKCGVAMSLTTALKWKGGGFSNVKLILYDEATDIREGLKVEHFTNFLVSMANSIEREKNDEYGEGIQLEIYGNTDFDSAHPLFQAFQIDPDENLVYVERKPEGAKRSTRILYINSRGLYQGGVSNSAFVSAVGDVKRAMDAFLNKAHHSSSKILSLDLTYLGEPYMAIIFTHENIRYAVKIATYDSKITRTDDMIDETWFVISVEPFMPWKTYNYHTITDEPVIASIYDLYIAEYNNDIKEYWEIIEDILRCNTAFFYGWDSTEMLARQIKKYIKPDETSF